MKPTRLFQILAVTGSISCILFSSSGRANMDISNLEQDDTAYVYSSGERRIFTSLRLKLEIWKEMFLPSCPLQPLNGKEESLIFDEDDADEEGDIQNQKRQTQNEDCSIPHANTTGFILVPTPQDEDAEPSVYERIKREAQEIIDFTNRVLDSLGTLKIAGIDERLVSPEEKRLAESFIDAEFSETKKKEVEEMVPILLSNIQSALASGKLSKEESEHILDLRSTLIQKSGEIAGSIPEYELSKSYDETHFSGLYFYFKEKLDKAIDTIKKINDNLQLVISGYTDPNPLNQMKATEASITAKIVVEDMEKAKMEGKITSEEEEALMMIVGRMGKEVEKLLVLQLSLEQRFRSMR